MTHVHAGGTHAADHAAAATHRHPRFAISLLGTSVWARLAIVAAVSALLWIAILWALA